MKMHSKYMIIYDDILHEHPGLEYVLDEYNDAKNEYKNKGGFKNE